MSRRTEKNVGVIGLGIIGQRVAAMLRQRGFHVFVWNRTPRPFPNFVGSPAEIAQLCDFVQIFVSDDEALHEMVGQMKPSLKAHHVVMAHCTVAPHSMQAAAEVVQRQGAQFLDAPFTGSKLAAEKGELVYYVAGDEAAFRRALPVLQASSKEILEIGEIGQATTIKLATNMFTAATAQVAAEALALVGAAGISPEKLAQAMSSNASNSATLAMKLPKMIAGDFEPHFSVKHMLKDVEIISRLARSRGLVFGATEAARASLVNEVQQGRGERDYSSLLHLFFPEGPVGKNEEAEAEQAMLAGLDETPPSEDERAADVPEMESVETEPDGQERREEEYAAAVENEKEGGAEPEAVEVELSPADGAAEEEIEQPEETEPEEEAAAQTEAVPVPTNKREASEEAPPRGFFSRMFGKGTDY